MNPNVVLPFLSSMLSFIFFVLLVDQWRERRRPYQAVWALGMLWYGLSAGTEFIGGAFGWSEMLYRIWYLIGAVWVAGWLGLGTMFLLGKTRFGLVVALSLFLAGLFTFLTQARYHYPNNAGAELIYFAIGLGLAVTVFVMTLRRDARWPNVVGLFVVIGSVAAAIMAFTAPLAAPGYVLNPQTHIPIGDLFPGYLRLLTPFFNITGAFALSLGAVFSAYVFIPKKRLIRYEIRRDRGPVSVVGNILLAVVAIPVNFIASVPGALAALLGRRLNSRVPATILIAIGGIIPAITSGLNRFGDTSGFFVGELLGVVFLFLGFLVSIEVFRDVRVPFTKVVLWHRSAEEPTAAD
ncbi:MAG: hypothetical protein ABI452_02405 [Candidatus Limnocylindrales bacterium]